jgi:fucose 4-O-acetylase-like acetyltransferase
LRAFLTNSFDLDYLKQRRILWIDYLRGLAIILVVYRHVLVGIERSGLFVPDYLVTANMIFYSFRMPLFFILSGLFISKSLARRPLNKLLFIKFETILYPYLIWCFIQVSLQVFFSSYTNASRTLQDYTYILYHPRMLDQFWYLPALFNVSVIYLFFKSKLKFTAAAQIIAGIVFYYLSRTFNQVSMISDWMEFYIFFAIGDLMSSFFFKKETQYQLQKPLYLFLIAPLFVLSQMYYLYKTEDYFLADILGRTLFIGISLLGCFFMFLFSIFIQNSKYLSFLRIIGHHSLYIYVMHVMISAVVRIILMKVFFVSNPLLLLIAGIFISIFLCIIIFNLAILRGPFWFLFFTTKPKVAAK